MDSDSILLKRFMQEHSKLAARALENIEPEDLASFFDSTPTEWLLDVVPLMSPQGMSAVFQRMNQETLGQLFETMETSRAAWSIRIMNEDLANPLLNRLSEEKSAALKNLLQYQDNTVGSLMDPRVFTLTENLTVKEAMAAIKKHKERIPPELFVLSADRKLVGVLPLSELIAGDPGTKIKSLANTRIITLSPEAPIQLVLTHQEWHNFYALPVVDLSSLFLGSVKLEDIRSLLVQARDKGEETGQLAITALGELYHLGLSGLLRSAIRIEDLSKE